MSNLLSLIAMILIVGLLIAHFGFGVPIGQHLSAPFILIFLSLAPLKSSRMKGLKIR